MVKLTTDKQKATGSHYTPTGLATVLARRLLSEVKENDRALNVLDPSCGDGELLLAIAEESKDHKLNLIGVEENDDAIQDSMKRFTDTEIKEVTLIKNDYLEMVNLDNHVDLFNFNESESNDLVDIIIANPPYVRTQILGAEKAQMLSEKFNLSGRVDLYHAFLVAMTSQLPIGGLLGVITSNRYLTTTGGTAIRQFLDENYEIIEIMDLGDTKLFSAAVLPAIFIGRKKHKNDKTKNNDNAKFFRIYEAVEEARLDIETNTVNSIFEILEVKQSGIYEAEGKKYKVSLGELDIPKSYKEPWVMASLDEQIWIDKIKQNSKYLIEDVAKVRVGIKTTADPVFIKNGWEDSSNEIQPEKELLRHLLSSDHASKWRPIEKRPALRVLYTHKVENGRRTVIDFSQYPKALSYLETHRERLEGRKYVIKAKRKWFEIWVPHDPNSWGKLKVVFPDISPEPKFFLDTEGCIVDGNSYWITLNEGFSEDILFLILAISNTRLMTKYHDISFQNKLYSGRRRYLTQYVEKYPIPNPETEYAKKLVSLSKELVYKENNLEKVKEIENKIEYYSAKAFNVEVVE
ncbi:N-6 DNA methylase [Paenibacillus barcinonensis]|uniref:site-specific DNA-methyltransferase (adenine-specific) n=1 Tax=Paenibacillus barcinonensis TaxID=198119 RepID=A0A2V4W4V7_PAEBA|nr:N-6 DNA methylase [Paenibacillus barcinonensis]PYE42684.1 TaqI restriction endonuclease [Paenibacillus barcinonensis]QKS58876.1 N-6 DNA methylase [Paenibacillus barcinonensis]